MGSFMCLVWLGLLGHLWLANPLHARTMYVSDVFEIVLRSEKEVAGRNVIKMLPTGTPVEVVDTDDSWATIRLADNRTGYALKRYLISRLPYKLAAVRLQQEVTQHKTRLATLTEQLTTLRQEHRRLQQLSTTQATQLTDITQKHQQLQQDASQYLQLRDTYDDLKRRHGTNQQQLQELDAAYDSLKKSSDLLKYLAGVGTILAGWVIGMITERFRGRRRRQGGSAYQLPR